MAYNLLSADDIVLSSEAVSTPMWSNGTQTIEQDMITSQSAQIMGLSSDYYVDYYYVDPNTGVVSGDVQFACAFADKYGHGANPYNETVPEYTPTRTIFGQYRSLVLGDEESDFYFEGSGSGVSSSFFWALSIDRARYKESLMEGSLHIQLSGSEGTLDLVDNSTIQNNTVYIDSGRVYNLIKGEQLSGSEAFVPVEASSSISYGYFLPDIGTLLVDGAKIRDTVLGTSNPIFNGETYVSSSNTVQVISTFVDSIQTFTLQAKETVTSNYVFVRVKNSEFNYSMNPSNITSTGELRHKVMANSPETYITSIGLYNGNSDLVAVAKLSRPLPKNFTKEALFRIKLDY